MAQSSWERGQLTRNVSHWQTCGRAVRAPRDNRAILSFDVLFMFFNLFSASLRLCVKFFMFFYVLTLNLLLVILPTQEGGDIEVIHVLGAEFQRNFLHGLWLFTDHRRAF